MLSPAEILGEILPIEEELIIMAMEDDYGMIDGIINNGKAPGLEERPSVLEQLKEKPVPDVSHKPPKSHPEREIE